VFVKDSAAATVVMTKLSDKAVLKSNQGSGTK
jgi:hypothetical protein